MAAPPDIAPNTPMNAANSIEDPPPNMAKAAIMDARTDEPIANTAPPPTPNTARTPVSVIDDAPIKAAKPTVRTTNTTAAVTTTPPPPKPNAAVILVSETEAPPPNVAKIAMSAAITIEAVIPAPPPPSPRITVRAMNTKDSEPANKVDTTPSSEYTPEPVKNSVHTPMPRRVKTAVIVSVRLGTKVVGIKVLGVNVVGKNVVGVNVVGRNVVGRNVTTEKMPIPTNANVIRTGVTVVGRNVVGVKVVGKNVVGKKVVGPKVVGRNIEKMKKARAVSTATMMLLVRDVEVEMPEIIVARTAAIIAITMTATMMVVRIISTVDVGGQTMLAVKSNGIPMINAIVRVGATIEAAMGATSSPPGIVPNTPTTPAIIPTSQRVRYGTMAIVGPIIGTKEERNAEDNNVAKVGEKESGKPDTAVLIVGELSRKPNVGPIIGINAVGNTVVGKTDASTVVPIK